MFSFMYERVAGEVYGNPVNKSQPITPSVEGRRKQQPGHAAPVRDHGAGLSAKVTEMRKRWGRLNDVYRPKRPIDDAYEATLDTFDKTRGEEVLRHSLVATTGATPISAGMTQLTGTPSEAATLGLGAVTAGAAVAYTAKGVSELYDES